MILRELLKRHLPSGLVEGLRQLRAQRHESAAPVRRVLDALGVSRPPIDDDTWFELQFTPEEARTRFSIPVPALPPDEVQIASTGASGRVNLQQAFSFYRYVCAVSGMKGMKAPRILDFGGGWGRISRFFLRDTRPERIVIVDCMTHAVRWLRATGNPCTIIQNGPRPPIEGLQPPFDLVVAYSVFSHLSEEYLHAWITYLMNMLRPGGHLVFTTRGTQFIDHLERLHREAEAAPEELQEHIRRLREEMPPPAEVRRRHLAGELQFYPIGGSGELTPDFFGETFIPRGYLERHYGPALVEFTEDVPNVDQSVVVLQRRPV